MQPISQRCLGGLLTIALLAIAIPSASDEPAKKPRKDFGIDKREAWTTSRVVGTPEPPAPYRMENAFPKIKFDEPLELAAVPGRDRWVVAQRKGKLYTFANEPQATETHLLIDVGKTVYGVVMHPDFAKNGYVYVTYVNDPLKEEPEGSRLVRFKATKLDPPEADPKSETLILTWPSGGHNGGCIRFGPDGFLYLSTGDGSGIADSLETGQKVDDLLGAILRIDVNQPAAGRGYRVPPDNPFVKMPGARPEIWAYGLRQSWKFSFDEAGALWAGEIGQDLWEMILRIEKGGNYGWSVMEGTHLFRPERKRGPTPILPPIVEHSHTDFRSIIGGYVYHAKRLAELQGAYVYGDFDTGKVWLLRYTPSKKGEGEAPAEPRTQDKTARREPRPPAGKVTEHRELTDTQLRIVAWGQDRAGEMYALDFAGGGIHRLIPAPPVATATPPFPRKLSDTGLFTSTKDLQPAAGLIPYSVNSELWSDGASKERFLALPGLSKIEFETVTYPQPAPGSQPGWRFPDGTVLVKTFFLEMEPGDPKSRRRLETRLLHKEQVGGTEEYGDQVWNGYTYLWNDAQTDAELLDAKGLDRTYPLKDAKAPGGRREQVWHFPSRTECTLCHTMSAKYALGVTTAQMNKDHDYGGVTANQLATLDHLGVFTKPLPEKPDKLARIADFHDQRESVDARARAYMHANCSHCHRKWGGGNAEFQLLASLPLAETGTINTRPGQGTFELNDPRILVPGDPERSLLLFRTQKLGLGRMPHVASNVVDTEAVALLREWIKQLPK